MNGMAGHSASPPDGGGTLAELMRTLEAIEKIPPPYRLTPAVDRYFKIRGAAKNDQKGEVLRMLRNPVDVEKVERMLPPGYRSLIHDTIAITEIHGGLCPNCLPMTATADVDIRVLDDESTEPMLRKVQQMMPKDGKVEVLLAGTPVPASTSDTELFHVLAAAMKRSEPGSQVAPVVSAGTSDSRYFRARGIVAYGIAPFKVNYYDADTVHGTDERIRARFFDEGVQLMRQIVRNFCARP